MTSTHFHYRERRRSRNSLKFRRNWTGVGWVLVAGLLLAWKSGLLQMVFG